MPPMATPRRWMSIWAGNRPGRPGIDSRPVQRNLLSAHTLRCRCLAAPKLIGDNIASISKALRQRNGYNVSENTAHKSTTASKQPDTGLLHRIRSRSEFEGLAIEFHRARRGSPTTWLRHRSTHPQQRIDIEVRIDHEAGFKEDATPGNGVMATKQQACRGAAMPWQKQPKGANDSVLA